jgi:hypothetical protein
LLASQTELLQCLLLSFKAITKCGLGGAFNAFVLSATEASLLFLPIHCEVQEVVKLAQASPEEYHRAFSELAAATAQHPLYMDEKDAVTGASFEQRIDVKDVQIVLKAVHGAETPQWLADRLMKVCEGRRDGKVSLKENLLYHSTAAVHAMLVVVCVL